MKDLSQPYHHTMTCLGVPITMEWMSIKQSQPTDKCKHLCSEVS